MRTNVPLCIKPNSRIFFFLLISGISTSKAQKGLISGILEFGFKIFLVFKRGSGLPGSKVFSFRWATKLFFRKRVFRVFPLFACDF